MKLVIEREGGFTIVDSAEQVTRIEVCGDAVEVWYSDSDGEESVKRVPVKDHAEACRVSAAIAVKCGELVEPLAEAPKTEPPLTQELVNTLYRASLSNGLEDAEDDDAMGAVMAGRARRAASEWVDGEPPRDGRWYVVAWGPFPNGAAWGAQWDAVAGTWRRHDGERVRGPGRHLPTPIPNR